MAAKSSGVCCGLLAVFVNLGVLGLLPVGVVTLSFLTGLSSFGCLPFLPISVGLGNGVVYFLSFDNNSIADSKV